LLFINAAQCTVRKQQRRLTCESVHQSYRLSEGLAKGLNVAEDHFALVEGTATHVCLWHDVLDGLPDIRFNCRRNLSALACCLQWHCRSM